MPMAQARRSRGQRPILIVALLVTALLAIVTMPSVAEAQWAERSMGQSTRTDRLSRICDVVVRHNGTVLATWITITGTGYAQAAPLGKRLIHRAYFAERRASGGWSPSKLVWSHATVTRYGNGATVGVFAGCPQIILGTRSSLDLLWQEQTSHRGRALPSYDLATRVRRPGGVWSAVRKVPGSDSVELDGSVSISEDGRAFVPARKRGQPLAYVRSPAGLWSRLGITSTRSANSFSALFDTANRMIVTWRTGSNGRYSRVRMSSGNLGPVEALPKAGDCVRDDPILAADGRGRVVAAWACQDISNYIEATVRDANGGWKPPTRFDVDAAGGPVGVDFDSLGTARIWWRIETPNTPRPGWTDQTDPRTVSALRASYLQAGSDAWQPATTASEGLPTPFNNFAWKVYGWSPAGIVDLVQFSINYDASPSSLPRVLPVNRSLTTLRRQPDGAWEIPVIHDRNVSGYGAPLLLVRTGGGRTAIGWTNDGARGAVVSVR